MLVILVLVRVVPVVVAMVVNGGLIGVGGDCGNHYRFLWFSFLCQFGIR